MYLLILLFTLFLIFYNKKTSIFNYLLILYVSSLTGSYILSPSIFWESSKPFLPNLVIFISLLFIIFPWKRYKDFDQIRIQISQSDITLYKNLIFFGSLFLLINIIIIYFLGSSVTDYSTFKNDGDSSYFQSRLPIPHFLQLIVAYFSPFFIVLLPYHFVFLAKGMIKQSIASLIISFNFVLCGFSSFSRSSAVVYILIFIILFLYHRKSIPNYYIKAYKFFSMIILLIIMVGLTIITLNRFAGDNSYSAELMIYSDTIISNPLIGSLLSYFSQWYFYGIKWIGNYEESLGGYMSFPLLNLIFGNILNLSTFSQPFIDSKIIEHFKDNYGFFLGVTAYALHDLGIIGSSLFFIIYNFVVKYIKKYANTISGQIIMVNLLVIPCTGIFSSALHAMFLHINLLLCLIYHIYSRRKRVRKFITNCNGQK